MKFRTGGVVTTGGIIKRNVYLEMNMKVLLTTPLYNFLGVTLKDGLSDLLLRNVLLAVLSSGRESDKSLSQKAKLFELGVKIAVSGGEIDLQPDEIQLLKDVVADCTNPSFSPLVVGQVARILDGKPVGIPIRVKEPVVTNDYEIPEGSPVR